MGLICIPALAKGRLRAAPLRMQVAAFVCLQPFLGTLLAFTVLGEKPSIWDLGAFGILFGLLLVTLEKAEKSDRPAASQIMSRIHLLMSQSGLPALGKPEKQ